MSKKIYGAWSIEEINALMKGGNTLEAFISIDNKILWQLRKIFGYKFFPRFPPVNEFWDFLHDHLDRFSFYKTVCYKLGLIKDDRLKEKITNFNEFRTKVVHNLYDKKITETELRKYCYLGIEIIEELEKIGNRLWTTQSRELRESTTLKKSK